jgi:hypothetical protein
MLACYTSPVFWCRQPTTRGMCNTFSSVLIHDFHWHAAAQEDFKGCLQKFTEKAQDEDGLVILKFAKSESAAPV